MVNVSPQAALIAQGVKQCKECREVKPLTDFFKHSHAAGGVNVDCKSCVAIKRRNGFLFRTYGITTEEYAALFQKQKGVCAICRKPPSYRSTRTMLGDKKAVGRLHVDHDHETGAVRALLCHHCNVAIGSFKHDVQLLQAAIEYLRQPRLF